jgi:hypothetical protein
VAVVDGALYGAGQPVTVSEVAALPATGRAGLAAMARLNHLQRATPEEEAGWRPIGGSRHGKARAAQGASADGQPARESRPMTCTLKTFTMVIEGKIIA